MSLRLWRGHLFLFLEVSAPAGGCVCLFSVGLCSSPPPPLPRPLGRRRCACVSLRLSATRGAPIRRLCTGLRLAGGPVACFRGTVPPISPRPSCAFSAVGKQKPRISAWTGSVQTAELVGRPGVPGAPEQQPAALPGCRRAGSHAGALSCFLRRAVLAGAPSSSDCRC